eukprot:TRINITY_DN17089_c0_g1_i1.p1 TRINITY_DN17089_c0_g1~~TRINITY_DN17089_c0_g1_i1.p1  ORF type:complete len:566 (+),score=44.00 TRINITY_DN17089_c0_g1_i1:1241-2938(+)
MTFAECCTNPFYKRIIKESDAPQQIVRKKIMCWVVLFGTPLLAAAAIAYYGRRPLTFWGCLPSLVHSILFLVSLVGFQIDVTDRMLCIWGFLNAVLFFLTELDSLVMLTTSRWPLFVIILDVLIVCQVSSQITLSIVVFAVLQFVVVFSERVYRYGLFDYEWGDYSQENRRASVQCANLPCAVNLSTGLSGLVTQVSVFVFDFYITSKFAKEAFAERNRILASIDAANHIANSLSCFDLTAAELLLDKAAIPEELKSALSRILMNLHSYKPYLPQSVFHLDDTSGNEVDISNSDKSLSSLTSTLSASLRAAHPSPFCAFKQVTASLFVSNISNSMSVLHHSIDMFKSLISDIITLSSKVVDYNRGSLDMFLGDRVFASFGASRFRTGHSCSCVRVASSFINTASKLLDPYQEFAEGLELNIGMGSGKLVCGDLGSESIMRFCVIGKLSLLVCEMERAGRSAGIKMLCESDMRYDIKFTYQTRVHLQLVRHNDEDHIVYEVIQNAETKEQEWLYEIASTDKWEALDKVAIAVMKGTPILIPPKYADCDDPYIKKLRVLLKASPVNQ